MLRWLSRLTGTGSAPLEAPPVDNPHVAPGCEPFAQATAIQHETADSEPAPSDLVDVGISRAMAIADPMAARESIEQVSAKVAGDHLADVWRAIEALRNGQSTLSARIGRLENPNRPADGEIGSGVGEFPRRRRVPSAFDGYGLQSRPDANAQAAGSATGSLGDGDRGRDPLLAPVTAAAQVPARDLVAASTTLPVPARDALPSAVLGRSNPVAVVKVGDGQLALSDAAVDMLEELTRIYRVMGPGEMMKLMRSSDLQERGLLHLHEQVRQVEGLRAAIGAATRAQDDGAKGGGTGTHGLRMGRCHIHGGWRREDGVHKCPRCEDIARTNRSHAALEHERARRS